jgi:cytochrome c-type biogenesis protein CcmE
MKPKTIIGILLLGAFGVLVMTSFADQLGGYTSFAEAENERRATVVGNWERDMPAVYDPVSNVFSFWMRDKEGDLRQVNYHQPKPANFEEAEEVVIDGHMAGEAFTAERILIKCPSKYNDERDFRDPADHPAGIPTPSTAVGTTSY